MIFHCYVSLPEGIENHDFEPKYTGFLEILQCVSGPSCHTQHQLKQRDPDLETSATHLGISWDDPLLGNEHLWEKIHLGINWQCVKTLYPW